MCVFPSIGSTENSQKSPPFDVWWFSNLGFLEHFSSQSIDYWLSRAYFCWFFAPGFIWLVPSVCGFFINSHVDQICPSIKNYRVGPKKNAVYHKCHYIGATFDPLGTKRPLFLLMKNPFGKPWKHSITFICGEKMSGCWFGPEHSLFFHSVGNVIIPTDSFYLYFSEGWRKTTNQRLVAMDRGHGEQWIDFPCGVRHPEKTQSLLGGSEDFTGHMEPAKSCDQFI